MLYGESVEDIVALTALEPLYRVDGDAAQRIDAAPLDVFPHFGYLVAVGYDYAHGVGGREMVFLHFVYPQHRGGYGLRLVGVHLFRHTVLWRRHGYESDAACGEQVVYAVVSLSLCGQHLVLVGQWHHLQLTVVKGIVGKDGDVLVHASLFGEHVHHIGIAAVALEQALEERQAAVGQADVVEQSVVHLRLLFLLLHHSGQLLVVAYEHYFAYGASSALVCSAEYPHQVRLQNLRGLIDDGQAELFHLEEIGVGVEGGGGAHEDARAGHPLLEGRHRTALPHLGVEQIWPVALLAREAAPDAYEVEFLLHQFAANLVDGAVGVGEQQHTGLLAPQFLLERVHQSVGGLAGARRSDDEEEVLCLPHFQGQGVERAVVAPQGERWVGQGRALQQEQVSALLGSREEGMHAAVECPIRRLEEIVLDGPFLFPVVPEHMAVHLHGAQAQGDLLLSYLLQGGTKHHGAPCVGLCSLVVGIQYHDVAGSEVGYVAVGPLGEPQGYAFHPVLAAGRGIHQFQVAVDVAVEQFGVQRTVPFVGESGALLGLIAHLGHEMLRGQEGHETVIVGPLQCRGPVQGLQQ